MHAVGWPVKLGVGGVLRQAFHIEAAHIVARRGPGDKTVRYLAGKGFGEDALEGIVARED